MNKFLHFGLKDTPTAIVDPEQNGTTERSLRTKYEDAIQSRMPLGESLLGRIAARPILAADLIADDWISGEDLRRLVSSPTVAMNIVAFRPSLFPIFRETILNTPETASQLYMLVIGGLNALGNPHGVNLPVTTDEILAKLEKDPRVLVALLTLHDKERATTEQHRILETVNSRKYESPGWAFQWLCLNEIPKNVPIEEALLRVLVKDESYSYLSMLLLRNRFYDRTVYAPLEAGITTPRGAYHVLRAALYVNQLDRLESLLIRDPAWLVEYLTEAKILGEERKKFYNNCAEVAYDHPLLPDLHFWYGNGKKLTHVS